MSASCDGPEEAESKISSSEIDSSVADSMSVSDSSVSDSRGKCFDDDSSDFNSDEMSEAHKQSDCNHDNYNEDYDDSDEGDDEDESSYEYDDVPAITHDRVLAEDKKVEIVSNNLENESNEMIPEANFAEPTKVAKENLTPELPAGGLLTRLKSIFSYAKSVYDSQ